MTTTNLTPGIKTVLTAAVRDNGVSIYCVDGRSLRAAKKRGYLTMNMNSARFCWMITEAGEQALGADRVAHIRFTQRYVQQHGVLPTTFDVATR